MGGSRPATSVTKTEEVKPKVWKTAIRHKDYENLAESNQFLRNELQNEIYKTEQETGTPAQLGARMRGYEMQEAAGRLASMPIDDKYIRATMGLTGDRYAPAREEASNRLSSAQTAYAQALQHVNDPSKPLPDRSKPGWSEDTIPQGMPTTDTATTTPSTETPGTTNTASANSTDREKGVWLRQGQVMRNPPELYDYLQSSKTS
jgi:hypothetical protein